MLILQMVLISRAKNVCKRIALVIRSPEKLIQLILLLVLITLPFVSIQQWEELYHLLVWKKTQAANVKKIYSPSSCSMINFPPHKITVSLTAPQSFICCIIVIKDHKASSSFRTTSSSES